MAGLSCPGSNQDNSPSVTASYSGLFPNDSSNATFCALIRPPKFEIEQMPRSPIAPNVNTGYFGNRLMNLSADNVDRHYFDQLVAWRNTVDSAQGEIGSFAFRTEGGAFLKFKPDMIPFASANHKNGQQNSEFEESLTIKGEDAHRLQNIAEQSGLFVAGIRPAISDNSLLLVYFGVRQEADPILKQAVGSNGVLVGLVFPPPQSSEELQQNMQLYVEILLHKSAANFLNSIGVYNN